MHRCLQVLDIFNRILDFACFALWDDDDPFQGHHNCYAANPILAALARTCRSFQDPTLNVLWRNQLTLGPLIRTLPTDAISEVIEHKPYVYCTHHLNIKRPILQSDWGRFDYYAEKIKRLGYYIAEYRDQDHWTWYGHNNHPCAYPVSCNVIARLCLYRRTPHLLPNLIAMRWTNFDVAYLRYLPMFLGPNLRALSIAFWRDTIAKHPDLRNELYLHTPELLQSIVSLCPSLTELEIWPPHRPEVVMAATAFLYGCERLEGFSITNIIWSKEVIRHLSQKETLAKTILSFDAEIASDLSFLASESSTLRYPFPALESLSIFTTTLDSCTELIKLMGQCRLRLIKFDFKERADSTDLYNLFVILWHNCSKTTLQSVYIETWVPRREYGLHTDHHTFNVELILPMLDFPNITAFVVAVPLISCMGDREIVHIARMWPHLMDLRLLDGWGWSRPSEVTFAAVSFLAWTCPQLMTLSLAVNATVDNVTECTAQPDFRPNTALRWFNAMDSIIGDAELFARSVHAFAPNTFDVRGEGWCELDEDRLEIPPEQDPIGFFQSVTDFVHEMRESEDGTRDVMSAEEWGAVELEGLNPWAPNAEVELWAKEEVQWIPADDWTPGA